jgi:hypothetical protein
VYGSNDFEEAEIPSLGNWDFIVGIDFLEEGNFHYEQTEFPKGWVKFIHWGVEFLLLRNEFSCWVKYLEGGLYFLVVGSPSFLLGRYYLVAWMIYSLEVK